MKWFLFISVLIGLSSCNTSNSSDIKQAVIMRDSVKLDITEFKFPNTTIRALEVINDSTVWFAGSNGYWGYTLDNGENWTTNQFTLDSITPEFRSISVNPNGDIFLVSIVKPAAVYKSSNMGKEWEMVYTDTDTNAFFDAIEFFNSQYGVLLGDAIDNCFHVAITSDGGNHWKRVNCSNLPSALDNENPFAASNTNISVNGTHAWFGTGGQSNSRVYHTPDFGRNWEVFNTPIVNGGVMTGIYSIHFNDSINGIIAGGDWDRVDVSKGTMSYTNDGGKTWSNDSRTDGFSSCIQFIPQTQGLEMFKLKGRARGGNSSMGYSNNNGKTWQYFDNTNYLSIQFSSKNIAWISGKEKIGKMVISKN
jgi:photosystem II stability/assembly factor-like uncharacterized protein